jgi:NADPH2:quinone reductase
MKSWRFHEFGHIGNLQMEEIDVPLLAQGEVLIKMEYAGLNPADRFLIMGRYQGASEPPYAVGRDGCGEVVKAAADAQFNIGDKVIFTSATVGINREGTLAEYVAIPEEGVALLPEWWSPADGAAGTKVFMTCWQALSDAADLKPDETVVVTGASGGIGLASLALAKAMGANTIALTRSAQKYERLLKSGADYVCETNDPHVVRKIMDLGGGDVIIDVVGGEFLAKCIEMTNTFGRICIVGALGGVNCEINPVQIIFKRLQIHGMQVSMYKAVEAQQALKDLLKVLMPTKARLLIDKIFPFDQVQEAFEHMRRGPMGKVIVGPIGDEK